MSSVRPPEIDLGKLMQSIREEVARRRAALSDSIPDEVHSGHASLARAELPSAIKLQLPAGDGIALQPTFHPKADGKYHVDDFLQYHDEEFIRAAYQAVLRRPPDPGGLKFYLNEFRNGSSKADILGRLRYSPEGNSHRVVVVGLRVPFTLGKFGRWPIVGRLMRIAAAIWTLPDLERSRQVDANHFIRLGEQIQDQDLRSTAALSGALRDLAQAHAEMLTFIASMASKEDLRRAARELRELADAIRSSKAEQSRLDETRESLVRALESRVDRSEIAALTNYLVNLVQARPTREDFKSLEETFGVLKAAIGHITQSKADQATLDEVQKQARETLLDEIAVLKNYFVNLVQACPTRDDLKSLEKTLGVLKDVIHQIDKTKADRTALDAAQKQAHESLLGALGPLGRQTEDLKRSQLEQGVRIDELWRKNVSAGEDHHLDAMYAGFEDKFRGTRSDIRQRQSFYLPYIRDAKAGTEKAPVIDLGCGRGEWLELLRDEGLIARGVDLNRVFLESCCEMKLDVTEQDAVAYLRSLKTGSVGAVTSYHLIEHLPFKALIELFDEALRVLRPGGVVILETPNPENLQVGACNFYTDPTHRNPMPPLLTEALLELRGFMRPVIIRRDQEERRSYAPPLVPNSEILAASINPMVEVLRDNFYVSPDYAVIATKA